MFAQNGHHKFVKKPVPCIDGKKFGLNFLSLTQQLCLILKEEMVEPAVIGTKNVIVAAAEAKVRRVVFTSSIGAVTMDPNRGPDTVVDESCWSDLEFCKNTKV